MSTVDPTNIVASYTVATVSTDSQGDVSGTFVDENGTTQSFEVTAADLSAVGLNATAIVAGETINILSNGFSFTTPEFATVAAPTVTLTSALSSIAATPAAYTGVTFTDGTVVSLADLNGPVTLNLAPTAPASSASGSTSSSASGTSSASGSSTVAGAAV